MWRLFCVAKLRRHCPVQPLTLANRAWLGPGSLAPDLETGELTTDPSRARYGMDEFHFQGDYFMYHHSDADTMEILDPAQMDRSVALWAAYAYVLGNLPEMLPRLAPAQPARRKLSSTPPSARWSLGRSYRAHPPLATVAASGWLRWSAQRWAARSWVPGQ
jgi:hypothetical protein